MENEELVEALLNVGEQLLNDADRNLSEERRIEAKLMIVLGVDQMIRALLLASGMDRLIYDIVPHVLSRLSQKLDDEHIDKLKRMARLASRITRESAMSIKADLGDVRKDLEDAREVLRLAREIIDHMRGEKVEGMAGEA